MTWTPPKPAETYDALVKQFRALCALHAAVEAQLRSLQWDQHREMQARALLEGERAANEILTAEIERLNAELDKIAASRMVRERTCRKTSQSMV